MKRYLQFSLIILSIALLLSAAGALSLLQLGGYVPFWIWATLGFNFLVSIALFLLAYSFYGDNKRKAVPKREKIMVPKQPVASQRIEKPKVTVVKTVVAASGTRSEKLEALRNAVLNPVFLNFVDELTPWHLRVLKFLDNPEEWLKLSAIPVPQKALGTALSVLFAAFPELEKRKAFARQLSRDLSGRGLASDWESMNIVTGRSGMFASQTTSLGKQFLEFVTSPVKKVEDNKT
jgi:hypothetical protein